MLNAVLHADMSGVWAEERWCTFTSLPVLYRFGCSQRSSTCKIFWPLCLYNRQRKDHVVHLYIQSLCHRHNLCNAKTIKLIVCVAQKNTNRVVLSSSIAAFLSPVEMLDLFLFLPPSPSTSLQSQGSVGSVYQHNPPGYRRGGTVELRSLH